MASFCNLSIWNSEEEVRGHPGLHSEFLAPGSEVGTYFKKQNTNEKSSDYERVGNQYTHFSPPPVKM